jgi:hypothetical protein
MKKFTLVLVLTICVFSLFAQQIAPSVTKGNPVPVSTRAGEFQCLPNAVFSQVFPTFDDGYYADNAYYFDWVADDYSASAPFSTMRFWGNNYSSCIPGATQTFEIKFYDGNPCSGGTLMYSFTKSATPLPNGLIPVWSSVECYQVDIDFGSTITLLNGWVSVSRVNPGDGCVFVWLAYDDGFVGNGVSHNTDQGCYNNGTDMLFCLGGDLETVPVSNWALLIGIALIMTIAVVRFRKVF